MMFEGKRIHYSPIDNKPLCSYSVKVCKQRPLKDYEFCIRHILEDKSAPFKQCSHLARYNNQKCTNPIPSNEERKFCSSHMQVAGILPKKERKVKREKDKESNPNDGKLKFADRLKALLKKENNLVCEDDTEDPYAFPDPVSENGTDMVAANALRTTMTCVQRTADSLAFELNKVDSSKTNNISAELKSKSHAPKLSKTMNRLQAKIAENKLLDKLKKSQESSHLSPSTPPPLINSSRISSKSGGSTPSTLSPIHKPKHTDLNKVKSCLLTESLPSSPHHPKSEPGSPLVMLGSVRSQDLTSPSQPPSHLSSSIKSDPPSSVSSPVHTPSSSSCHNSKSSPFSTSHDKVKSPPSFLEDPKRILHRIQELWENQKRHIKDLYPRSYAFSSESESNESEEESTQLYHQHWSSIWDNKIMRGLHTNIWDCRTSQQRHLQKELSQHLHQLRHVNAVHRLRMAQRAPLVRALALAARCHPTPTAQLLLRKLKIAPKPPSKSSHKSLGLERHTCCFKHECSSCTDPVLPYTRHCIKHIMYNVDQLLFEHCTAKFPDHTQCCIPVFDIIHELPLCHLHALKRITDSNDETGLLTSEPKPKKPRKRPKPSAYTRPPKRGKKKKKPPNQLRPPSPPSSLPTLSNESNQAPSSSLSSTDQSVVQLPPVSEDPCPPPPPSSKPEEVPTPAVATTTSVTASIESELGSDLEEQFSPGAIEKHLVGLPMAELANQTSKLLEEHDFTEVLNKIPDYAFSDLFAEAKNGDYVPSKEETEELERALAAVSKDVHLAKESLAKLSSSQHQDLEELGSTMEIPLLGGGGIDETFPDLAAHDLSQVLSLSPNAAADLLTPTTSTHLNGFTAGLHSLALPQDVAFSLGHHPAFLDGAALSSSHPTPLDARLSSLVYNPAADHTTYAAAAADCLPVTGNHWMLNPAELAQLGAYHSTATANGFLIATAPTRSNTIESPSSASSLQQTAAPTKVIAQEGAS